MNTRELMMGNLLQIEGSPVEVIKIFEIHLEVHSSIFQFSIVEIEEVEPIQLTEEWLIRCGGEIIRSSSAISLDRFRFIWKDPYNYWYVVDQFSKTYLTKTQYVHELQNFYKVMNGQELIIKDL